MSTQFAFQPINHQCAIRCYQSHTDSFTDDREQPTTDYQIHPKIHCREFTCALIALHVDEGCSSVIALLHNIVKGVTTNNHKHVVDTGNNETRRFVILPKRNGRGNLKRYTTPMMGGGKESFTATPQNGGLVPYRTMCTSALFKICDSK